MIAMILNFILSIVVMITIDFTSLAKAGTTSTITKIAHDNVELFLHS